MLWERIYGKLFPDSEMSMDTDPSICSSIFKLIINQLEYLLNNGRSAGEKALRMGKDKVDCS
jgi:hypothetical protein